LYGRGFSFKGKLVSVMGKGPVFSNLFLLKKEREKSAFGLQEAQT
jgi:hypothetical protein